MDTNYMIQEGIAENNSASQTPVRINDDNAAEKTLAQINAIESENDRMRAINALYKKYGPEFHNHIELLENEKRKIENNFRFSCSKKPFPHYCFANNNSNKSRLEKKLQEIIRRESTFKAKGNEEIIQGDIRIIFNIQENRTQIFFPGKPDETTRGSLKSNGFRWAPSSRCWQAYYNNRSKAFAKTL